MQTLNEKLQVDVDRKKRKVIDAEIIRKSLQDFEQVVDLLPMEDQKELLQLLIKEIYVYPFDPKREALPPDGETFSARIRTKWYKVRLTLHQLPGVQLQNQTFLVSSENRLIGSPGRTRTYNLAVNSRPLYH